MEGINNISEQQHQLGVLLKDDLLLETHNGHTLTYSIDRRDNRCTKKHFRYMISKCDFLLTDSSIKDYPAKEAA